MPVIYLSPSTQEWNAYVTGSGSEEYHMNRLMHWCRTCGPIPSAISATGRI